MGPVDSYGEAVKYLEMAEMVVLRHLLTCQLNYVRDNEGQGKDCVHLVNEYSGAERE